jgi:hypothetical protein
VPIGEGSVQASQSPPALDAGVGAGPGGVGWGEVDACEELADDLRNLTTLSHSLRMDLVVEGQVKDGP